jgi:hypothetical protein
MKRKLEMAANVTVIVVALAVGFVVLTSYARSYPASRSIAAGDHLASLPGVDWKQHQRTLVLALNTGCHYCEDSVPFYQVIAAAISQGKEDVGAVALFPNNPEAVRQFSSRQAFPIRTLGGVSFEVLHVVATPTLILVDRQGRVEHTWIGELTSQQEQDLLAIISKKARKQRGE